MRKSGVFLKEKIGDQAGALGFTAVVGTTEPVACCFEKACEVAIFAGGGGDAIVCESIACAEEGNAFFHEFADLGESDNTAKDAGLSFQKRRGESNAQEQEIESIHQGLILECVGHGECEDAGQSGHGVVVMEGKQCPKEGFEIGHHRWGNDLVDGDDDLFAHRLDGFHALLRERWVVAGFAFDVLVDLKAEIALCGDLMRLAWSAASFGHGISASRKEKEARPREEKHPDPQQGTSPSFGRCVRLAPSVC